MAFTANLSGTAQIPNSIALAFDKQFLIAVGQNALMDQFVSEKMEIGAKSIQVSKYPRLALATTPLSETTDITSVAISDSQILFTPAEYGNAVTRTQLASLQSAGKIDLAIPELVGINMGQTQDQLALNALAASTNVAFVNNKTTATLAVGDVMSSTFLNQMYNKLARLNVPAFEGNAYVAVMHDDVINDLRGNVASGEWTDVSKYTGTVENIFTNEVGMFRGFRIVRNNFAQYAQGTGGDLVDTYSSYFIGARSLAKVSSKEPTMVVTGPFDTLARTVNIGWYGVFTYGILDTDAVWVGKSASSVGNNLA